MADDNLMILIKGLAIQLGRPPTVDEVREFIFGTKEQRHAIWNKEKTNAD